jgi:formiminoglutamate deiminase
MQIAPAAPAPRRFFLKTALLPGGWARNVRLETQDGRITAVIADSSAEGAETLPGIALPGLPNLHSHAFQRGMAGLAEKRGPADDSFWTWRDVMYRFLNRLTPEDVQTIAAMAYLDMLEAGFTAVAEFHYLHHTADGSPYADPAELSARILAAAEETGLGLTLLPVLYARSGFGGAAPLPAQRRFINGADRFLTLVEAARAHATRLPGARIGIAPHSLRAVTPDLLSEVLTATPCGPVHIHIAEQMKEVEDCIAWCGQRPVRWLLDHQPVSRRWTLVHATHLSDDELRDLAASEAVAGLCPITEANLGDGIFRAVDYQAAGGIWGVGSDSNVETDAAGELRLLEYSQRLSLRGRNLLSRREGDSTGRRLFDQAAAGGAQALGQDMGRIAPGARADLLLLDPDHPDLAAAEGDRILDAFIFCGGRSMLQSVMAGGRIVVSQGRHHQRDAIRARYRSCLTRLLSA